MLTALRRMSLDSDCEENAMSGPPRIETNRQSSNGRANRRRFVGWSIGISIIGAALVATWLLWLVAGLPFLGRNSLTTSIGGLGSVESLGGVTSGGTTTSLVRQIVLLGAWAAWLWFLVSLVISVGTHLSGTQGRARDGLATKMVPGFLLSVVGFLMSLSMRGQVPSISPPAVASASVLSGQPVVAVEQHPDAEHHVQAGDSLWDVASKWYGDGSRWREILEANKGVIQNDGNYLSDSLWIYPGWRLTIPNYAGRADVVPASAGSAPVGTSSVGAESAGTASVGADASSFESVSYRPAGTGFRPTTSGTATPELSDIGSAVGGAVLALAIREIDLRRRRRRATRVAGAPVDVPDPVLSDVEHTARARLSGLVDLVSFEKPGAADGNAMGVEPGPGEPGQDNYVAQGVDPEDLLADEPMSGSLSRLLADAANPSTRISLPTGEGLFLEDRREIPATRRSESKSDQLIMVKVLSAHPRLVNFLSGEEIAASGAPLEMIVYLALTCGPVGSARLLHRLFGEDASPKTLRNNVSIARSLLGNDKNGAPLLAYEPGTRQYRLSKSVVSDLAVFENLVNKPGLAGEPAEVGEAEALEAYEMAFDLVESSPMLDATRRYDWWTVDGFDARADALVVDAAVKAIELASTRGELGLVRSIFTRARLVAPCSEALFSAAFVAAGRLGQFEWAKSIWDQLAMALRDELDSAPSYSAESLFKSVIMGR